MKNDEYRLLQKRKALLGSLAKLGLLVQGSYLERFSTCVRTNCVCHRGQRHGPRSYVVVYRDRKQHQVYVPVLQRDVIREGIRQYEQLLDVVREITRINLQLMRLNKLAPSTPRRPKATGGSSHE